MKLKKPNSAFYRWWNSYSGRRIISATYSLGAAVVIMGAMFKILHLPIGNYMLGIGMTVESFIFALGIFDKPYREYDWSKIFNFKAEDNERINPASVGSVGGSAIPVGIFRTGSGNVEMSGENQTDLSTSEQVFEGNDGVQVVGSAGGIVLPSESLSEDNVTKLNESIKNLADLAEQLQVLGSVSLSTSGLAKSIESATEITAAFAESQSKLNANAETLAASYQQVNGEIDTVVSNTIGYSSNVENVNKTLISINSIYELQLRQLQSQVESLQSQAESLKNATEKVEGVSTDMDKMKEAATIAQMESHRYQNATKKLSKQVEDLNAIYGNMLNALS